MKIKRYYWNPDMALFPMPKDDTRGLCKSDDVDKLEAALDESERKVTKLQLDLDSWKVGDTH